MMLLLMIYSLISQLDTKINNGVLVYKIELNKKLMFNEMIPDDEFIVIATDKG